MISALGLFGHNRERLTQQSSKIPVRSTTAEIKAQYAMIESYLSTHLGKLWMTVKSTCMICLATSLHSFIPTQNWCITIIAHNQDLHHHDFSGHVITDKLKAWWTQYYNVISQYYVTDDSQTQLGTVADCVRMHLSPVYAALRDCTVITVRYFQVWLLGRSIYLEINILKWRILW